MGVVSYGLFAVAVLHAWLLDGAERRLRAAGPATASTGGVPLLQLERLTFRFVEVGFVVLSTALVLGVLLAERWRWDHKTVLSLLGWATFAVLIAGRHLRGWRGRRATRWVYAGALLLLLAYAGARFVIEVVLQSKLTRPMLKIPDHRRSRSGCCCGCCSGAARATPSRPAARSATRATAPRRW